MSTRRAYATDLSDEEWRILKPLVSVAKPGGLPRAHATREILDTIFYEVRGGCACRLLPHEFPPWKTLYHYFRLWRIDGTWERVNGALRERVRALAGREASPGAAIVDSQSVKTTERGGVRGYDGAKKVNGRKRHLLVDAQGLVMKAKAHSLRASLRIAKARCCCWSRRRRPPRASITCGRTRATPWGGLAEVDHRSPKISASRWRWCSAGAGGCGSATTRSPNQYRRASRS